MNDVRCLVKKDSGDFDRAAELGYGINLYCAEGYMWLIMSNTTPDEMEGVLSEHDFVKVSRVEYR